MSNSGQSMLYHEVQRPRQIWVWAIVLFAAGAAWLTFIQQFLLGDESRSTANDIFTVIIWLAFGLLFPAFVAILKLEISVTEEKVTVRFFPLLTRRIPTGTIAFAAARDYKPLREYGGWGIRHTPRNGSAYSMSGSRGVQLALNDERLILLGSRRSDELAAVIAGAAGIPEGEPEGDATESQPSS